MCKHLYGVLLFLLLFKLSIFLNLDVSDYTLYESKFEDSGNRDNTSKELEETKDDSLLSLCIESGYHKECSGHGICIDGTCQCDSFRSQENNTESLYEYTGRYCEECPYCKGQRCDKLLPCVESILRNSTSTTKCSFYYKLVEDINLEYNDKFCYVEDSNRCMVKFKYVFDNTDHYKLFMNIDKNVECLHGRNYIIFGWCLFIFYMVVLMMIFKML